MPKFFFDVHDGGATFDDIGLDLPGVMDVRREALRGLPSVAAEEIPMGEDRRHFTVLVKNDAGLPIYSATMSFVGIRLVKPSA